MPRAIERWNGTVWRTVTAPSAGGGTSPLRGVSAVSGADVWKPSHPF